MLTFIPALTRHLDLGDPDDLAHCAASAVACTLQAVGLRSDPMAMAGGGRASGPLATTQQHRSQLAVAPTRYACTDLNLS